MVSNIIIYFATYQLPKETLGVYIYYYSMPRWTVAQKLDYTPMSMTFQPPIYLILDPNSSFSWSVQVLSWCIQVFQPELVLFCPAKTPGSRMVRVFDKEVATVQPNILTYIYILTGIQGT